MNALLTAAWLAMNGGTEIRLSDPVGEVRLENELQDETPERPPRRRRGEQPAQPQDQPAGGGLSMPTISYLSVGFYPYLEFSGSGFGTQNGTTFDLLLDMQSILPRFLPLHSHVGVITVNGGDDFDLVILKLGTGFSPSFGDFFFADTLGTAVFLSKDYGDGSPFAFLIEARLGMRGVLLPTAVLSVGYTNINNIGGGLAHREVDYISGFFISLGIGQ